MQLINFFKKSSWCILFRGKSLFN